MLLFFENVSELVEGIGGIGDKFVEQNFLASVEGADDEAHEVPGVNVVDKALDSRGFRL